MADSKYYGEEQWTEKGEKWWGKAYNFKYSILGSFTEKGTFEQRPRVGERISYVDTWGKSVSGTGTSTCKGPRQEGV